MSREVCGICWCPYDEDTGECACEPAPEAKHMTNLRTAAQQALEALEKYRKMMFVEAGCRLGEGDASITALRAALADGDNLSPTEPVAKVELMLTGGNAGLATRIVEIDDHLRERLRPGQLLYTAPPQRKPLTDEEIDNICRQAHGGADPQEWSRNFARAVERAHGIGGEE